MWYISSFAPRSSELGQGRDYMIPWLNGENWNPTITEGSATKRNLPQDKSWDLQRFIDWLDS